MPNQSDASAVRSAPSFTGGQLRSSIVFEFGRELRGVAGQALVEDVLSRLAAREQRKRALKPEDALLRLKTINVLLANLAVAALNRANPKRFVAISLNSNDYAGTGLSFTAIKFAFQELPSLGLAIGKKGVAKPDGMGERRGMRSRLRATVELRDLMRSHGLGSKDIKCPPKPIIHLKGSIGQAGPEPSSVSESRAVLERVNVLLANAELHLPDDAWSRIAAAAPEDKLSSAERMHRQYAGDLSAKRLYRVFNQSWHRGGRLYGGWWIGVPKGERKLIEIDGECTVELDYGQLHPTMLFAKVGLRLDFDPYQVGSFSRELGKDTFMRLLNRTRSKGGRYIRRAGKVPLPGGIAAAAYTQLYKEHLAPVKHLLGTGMGLSLQREDSDLALAVLARLSSVEVVALPIHDSFIVKKSHEKLLRVTMIECFTSNYGFKPIVK